MELNRLLTVVVCLILLASVVSAAQVNDTGKEQVQNKTQNVSMALNATGYNIQVNATVVHVNATAAQVNATPGNATAVYDKLGAPQALVALVGILAVFLAFVILGYRSNSSLNRGEMRRAIAGAFVFTFVVLIFVLLHLHYNRINEVIASFMAMITTIVGFYFGSRTAQQEAEEGEVVGIENAEFRDGKIVLSFRNGGRKSVEVDAVYVNRRRVETPKVRVSPRSLAEISVSFEWKEGEEYEIKACTSKGKCSQIRVRAPKRGGKE